MNSTDKGNAGEFFVNEIAFNSFMKHWCYPSPRDERGDKNEICDLLILFDTVLILISVKNYEFKEEYSRYFRRTIDKAVRQIYGAERKLFSNNKDIHIKHPDKNEEMFPKERINKVHRIIVNLGEGVKFYPFNKETIDEKFISLFDKESFETIIKELDTIPDFIEYLTKREELFFNKIVTIMPGEEEDFPLKTASQFHEYSKENFVPMEKQSIILSGTEHDLLAHYLEKGRSFPEAMKSPKYNGMFIQLDGHWQEFKVKKAVLLKKKKDKNSYFIDELVKREVLPNINPKSEELAKELLSFDRFHRRMIADSFFQFYDSYKDNQGLNIARRYGDFEGTGIVFFFYTPEMENHVVNILLEIAVDSFCVYSNYKSKKIIVLATTRKMSQFKIGLVKDIKPFNFEKEQQIKDDVKKLGWFTKHEEFNFTDAEYPKEE